MTPLSRLSLHNKFLVSPTIGLTLMLLLAGVVMLTTENQSERLAHLEREELMMAERLMGVFGELSENHALIFDLLVGQNPDQDEGAMYDRGKPYLYKVYQLEEQLDAPSLVASLNARERSLHKRLREELIKYRSFVTSALEMTTVDFSLASRHMSLATTHYIQLEKQFLTFLEETRKEVAEEFAILKMDTRQGLQLFSGIILLASLCMVLAAIYFSRKLSLDLYSMITVMGRLAAGERDIAIPTLSASREMETMAQALGVFKENLRQLDATTEQTLRTNRSLEQEVRDRKRAEEGLRLAASVFEFSLEGIVITDAETRILSVNPAFTRITGYTPEEAIGQTPRLLRSDHHDDTFYRDLWASIIDTGMWQGEIWNRRKDGEVYPEWRNISTVTDEQGRTIRYISIFTDITEKKISEEHIHRLAHYDVLTDLPNRALFQERLEQSLIMARRHDMNTGILFLDLDRFKLINDSLGHPLGDLLLQEVAKRLQSCVRKVDTVARLGGDEFTVIIQELKSGEDAVRVAQKILQAFTVPFQLGEHEVYTSASIGISMFPGDGEDLTTLLKNADDAMYRAKEQGKNTYQFYTGEIQAVALERMNLENNLRRALNDEEFILHYQPRVDSVSEEIVGLEALVRWDQPQLGMVPPDKFIPVAEETGLIVPLGRWILLAACAQYRTWQLQGVAPAGISINLSGRQFQDSRLLDDIAEMLQDTGLEAHCIELELTESVLMENPEQSIATLNALKAMGFRISVDDFGTAYSSLSYLKRFPVDILKIDQSFVRDVPHDPDDVAIVKTIISMAQNLGLSIIAEGVETQAQRDFLLANGCNEMQGYYFSRPLDLPVTTHLLNEERPFKGA